MNSIFKNEWKSLKTEQIEEKDAQKKRIHFLYLLTFLPFVFSIHALMSPHIRPRRATRIFRHGVATPRILINALYFKRSDVVQQHPTPHNKRLEATISRWVPYKALNTPVPCILQGLAMPTISIFDTLYNYSYKRENKNVIVYQV